jgi:hypothetical protein
MTSRAPAQTRETEKKTGKNASHWWARDRPPITVARDLTPLGYEVVMSIATGVLAA